VNWIVSQYSKFKLHGPKLEDSVHLTPELSFLMIGIGSSYNLDVVCGGYTNTLILN